MLKFTALLSDQFRRASSVSSLKSYQQSKQKSKPLTFLNPIINYNSTNNTYNSHLDNHISYQDYRNCRPLQSHSFGNNLQCSYHSVNSNQTNSRFYSHKSNIRNYQSVTNQGFQTPSRLRVIQKEKKPQNMLSTAITKIQVRQGDSNENNGVLKQQFNSNMDNISINLKNPIQKGKNIYSSYQLGEENQSILQRTQKIREAKNHQSVKMRISSINCLQNIQKKIQSSLGHERSLKI